MKTRIPLWSLILGPLTARWVEAASDPHVKVALNASFAAPPETAADENATSYFPLLDRIADGYFVGYQTDRELYAAFRALLREDGHLTGAEGLSSFDLALSIHAAAPRIEAHYQFCATSVRPTVESRCNSWVQLDGKQYCSQDFDVAQDTVGSHQTVASLPFDRLLDESSGVVPHVVLYADVTSPDFAQFHRRLVQSARAGRSTYRIRYTRPAHARKDPLTVSGYGVELALKRTDYVVIDDRQGEQDGEKQQEPGESGLEEGETADLKPLTASDLSKLSIRAANLVMSSDDPLETLLRLTEDFPKHSVTVSGQNTSLEFLEEHRANRGIIVPPGYNVIWINGVQMDARQLDAYSLIAHLRRERSLINGFRKLGFSGKEAIELLSHKAIAEAQGDDEPARYDFRDSIEGGNVIVWMNDIERDRRYQGMPRGLGALMQRTYPGQLPPVRRDIHNLILPVDFTNAKDVEIVVESLQSFVRRKVPVRFGLVPLTPTLAAVGQAKVVYHLAKVYGLGAAIEYLESLLHSKKTASSDKKAFHAVTKDRKVRKDQTALTFSDVLGDDAIRDQIEASQRYLQRLDVQAAAPAVFVNGVAIPRNDEWLQAMSARVTTDLIIIQGEIMDQRIDEDTYIPGIFLNSAALRRNSLIVPDNENNITVVDVVNMRARFGDVIDKLPRLPADSSTGFSGLSWMLVAADFDTSLGRDLLLEVAALKKSQPGLAVSLCHNRRAEGHGTQAPLFQRLSEGLDLSPTDLERLLSSDGYGPVASGSRPISDAAVKSLLKYLNLEAGGTSFLVNGRLVGPMSPSKPFGKDDLEALLFYELRKRVIPLNSALYALGLHAKVASLETAASLSSLVALSTTSNEAVSEGPASVRTDVFNAWSSEHTAIKKGDADQASIHVVAVLDPATEIAQRWVPMIKILSELDGTYLRLFLNPREKVDELPVKRFYRNVLESKPRFNAGGSLVSLNADFGGLPRETLLTMAMDVPSAWLVAPKESIHDLDNIKVSSLKGHSEISAVYELENILIEGHSRDVTSGSPPRGAQLVLGTERYPQAADTIVMANLGYFQFKANPGLFKLGLRPGRSEEIYRLDSAGTNGYLPHAGHDNTQIALTSFRGVTLYPRLSRKPGQEEADVLEANNSAMGEAVSQMTHVVDHALTRAGLGKDSLSGLLKRGAKLGQTLLSKVGMADLGPREVHADINIFSVASGHLYERMLNIMMLSVMRHTSHTVKFWFIEQFLSPSFKSFLPHLAAEYGFSYQMVTYKWPHWLRAQKEKQRVIWGYKILFLDVLFPLDLDKVIFVDADQVVRTDLHDLVTLDLKGAPYAFTPMCDSRTEMEGFRFWKQGYWKTALRGLPYHISALYVVNLKRFRQLAAGDRLRQQYHSLSADPNSLSNLDQDLPNHMQAAIPIHSLPQDWLWCETWCSDESLKEAKTIDLCNNPLTKEPKLDRARRQLPEWTLYDEEIARLARRVKERAGAEAQLAHPLGTEQQQAEEAFKLKDEL